MTKPLMTRPARNTIRDLTLGLAAFFAIALLVGAVSTDAFSLDAGASGALQSAPRSFGTAAIVQAASPANIQSHGNSAVLALESYERQVLAQHMSFSGRQIGIMLLAMMFALISTFVCQSTRHLRRAAAASRREEWRREDWG